MYKQSKQWIYSSNHIKGILIESHRSSSIMVLAHSDNIWWREKKKKGNTILHEDTIVLWLWSLCWHLISSRSKFKWTIKKFIDDQSCTSVKISYVPSHELNNDNKQNKINNKRDFKIFGTKNKPNESICFSFHYFCSMLMYFDYFRH